MYHISWGPIIDRRHRCCAESANLYKRCVEFSVGCFTAGIHICLTLLSLKPLKQTLHDPRASAPLNQHILFLRNQNHHISKILITHFTIGQPNTTHNVSKSDHRTKKKNRKKSDSDSRNKKRSTWRQYNMSLGWIHVLPSPKCGKWWRQFREDISSHIQHLKSDDDMLLTSHDDIANSHPEQFSLNTSSDNYLPAFQRHQLYNQRNANVYFSLTTTKTITCSWSGWCPLPAAEASSRLLRGGFGSYQSCLCKTMERMINDRLVWFLESNHLITDYQ
jgi:hypothetical protein